MHETAARAWPETRVCTIPRLAVLMDEMTTSANKSARRQRVLRLRRHGVRHELEGLRHHLGVQRGGVVLGRHLRLRRDRVLQLDKKIRSHGLRRDDHRVRRQGGHGERRFRVQGERQVGVQGEDEERRSVSAEERQQARKEGEACGINYVGERSVRRGAITPCAARRKYAGAKKSKTHASPHGRLLICSGRRSAGRLLILTRREYFSSFLAKELSK